MDRAARGERESIAMVNQGRPFQPGNQYGRGRPRGSRNKRNRLGQELLDSHAESLVGRALLLASKGDVGMRRALLPYLLARQTDAPLKTAPLPVHTAEELAQSSEALLQRAVSGQITVQEAQQLSALMEDRRRIMETQDFAVRLRALEEQKRNDG